ncbi:recombinase family protein [Protofrankia symbiont of Coriaria ruscifolia]|uniref:recombinase family protein n=1 Tax=Protofrankia symbiont of Coriaria ruscifolia TaxID=1306542 RepID=UPI001F5EFA14|nr:recombinase family protein [Protofrankia symbiont of Coriaria ruscifolia]
MSKGERNRIKIRMRTAMAAQAKTEGRYLGGRPPYGYRIADAGPHPNPAKAADGKRLHVLEPDPVTSPVVARIFSEYAAGRGLYAITEGLTADCIPSPSAHDPARNPHRTGAWSKPALRAILTNPRYTGRQVWNRQRKDEVLLNVEDVALGYETRMRWNDPDVWIYSAAVVHSPLVDDDAFAQVQARYAARRLDPSGPRESKRTRHPYQLRGRMRCGICQRRM